MDSKSLRFRKLRNRFPLIGVSGQCSNFNLKCFRLEKKHASTSISNVFPTWNRCFVRNAKSLYTFIYQYSGDKDRSEIEKQWNQFTIGITNRLNTYCAKDRIKSRINTICDKVNRDYTKLKEEILLKPEFKTTFSRQASKLNQFKGTFNRPDVESAKYNWIYAMGQACSALNKSQKLLEKRYDPRWNWFITVKCDYLFGDRNPVWDQAVNTLIGNFKRLSKFHLNGEHSGIYR